MSNHSTALAEVVAAAEADGYGPVMDDDPEPALIHPITRWAAKGHGRMRSWDSDFHGLIHAELMRRDAAL